MATLPTMVSSIELTAFSACLASRPTSLATAATSSFLPTADALVPVARERGADAGRAVAATEVPARRETLDSRNIFMKALIAGRGVRDAAAIKEGTMEEIQFECKRRGVRSTVANEWTSVAVVSNCRHASGFPTCIHIQQGVKSIRLTVTKGSTVAAEAARAAGTCSTTARQERADLAA